MEMSEKNNVSDHEGGASASLVERSLPNTVLEYSREEADSRFIPPSLWVSKEERTTAKYDQWGEIPVIDLSSQNRDDLVKKVGSAARDWGIFQVVNHNICIQSLSEVEEEVTTFFHLPNSRKLKLQLDVNNFGVSPVYYTGDNSKQELHSLHWAESLVSLWKEWDDVEGKTSRNTSLIWPEGNEKFRSAVYKILTDLRELTEELLHFLAQDLGLEKDIFSKCCFPRGSSLFRWNFYPRCAAAGSTLGAHAHTDPNLLTIVYQDKHGGLQVQKGNDWVGVRPVPGALIINVGDCLEIFSNGLFHAIVHRVLVNEKAHRLSLACIYYLDPLTLMYAPEEVVNDEHPRRFKPITSGEYWKLVFDKRSGNKSLRGFNGLVLLEDQIVTT